MTTSSSMSLSQMRSTAWPERIGWTQATVTLGAPRSRAMLGGGHDRAAGVDLVVDDEDVAAFDVADQVLGGDALFVADALLVDDRQRRAEQARDVARALGAADVGREHGDVGEVALLEVAAEV